MYLIKSKKGNVIIKDLGFTATPDKTFEVDYITYQLSKDIKKLANFLIVEYDGDEPSFGGSGSQGPKGEKGDKGDRGPQGIQGPKGDKGETYNDSELRSLITELQSKITILEEKIAAIETP